MSIHVKLVHYTNSLIGRSLKHSVSDTIWDDYGYNGSFETLKPKSSRGQETNSWQVSSNADDMNLPTDGQIPFWELPVAYGPLTECNGVSFHQGIK